MIQRPGVESHHNGPFIRGHIIVAPTSSAPVSQGQERGGQLARTRRNTGTGSACSGQLEQAAGMISDPRQAACNPGRITLLPPTHGQPAGFRRSSLVACQRNLKATILETRDGNASQPELGVHGDKEALLDGLNWQESGRSSCWLAGAELACAGCRPAGGLVSKHCTK